MDIGQPELQLPEYILSVDFTIAVTKRPSIEFIIGYDQFPSISLHFPVQFV